MSGWDYKSLIPLYKPTSIIISQLIRASSNKIVMFRMKCYHKSTGGAIDAMTTFTCLGLKEFRRAWLDAAPKVLHVSNVLSYLSSAIDVDRSIILKGIPPPAFRHTVVEESMVTSLVATKKLYHPVELYMCAVVRPRLLLSYVFPLTKFVRRSLSLPEKCALFDVPLAFLGTLNNSKLN